MVHETSIDYRNNDQYRILSPFFLQEERLYGERENVRRRDLEYEKYRARFGMNFLCYESVYVKRIREGAARMVRGVVSEAEGGAPSVAGGAASTVEKTRRRPPPKIGPWGRGANKKVGLLSEKVTFSTVC